MSERERYSDDVLRIKDEMDLHAVAGAHGWVAFALADGTPKDHNARESWSEAVKSCGWDRDNYFYLEIQPDGMPYKEAEAVLKYARTVHNMGYRIPDPNWEHYEAASMPRTKPDRQRAARQLVTGKPITPDDVPYGNLPYFFRKVN